MRKWTNDDRMMIARCNDGTRPVIFKIERIDIPENKEEKQWLENRISRTRRRMLIQADIFQFVGHRTAICFSPKVVQSVKAAPLIGFYQSYDGLFLCPKSV